MIETLMQQMAGFLLCLVIIILTEPNINRMDRRAPLLLRLGLWALCVAAAAGILFILMGDAPPWPTLILALGVCCYLLGERRLAARQQWDRCRRDYTRPA